MSSSGAPGYIQTVYKWDCLLIATNTWRK